MQVRSAASAEPIFGVTSFSLGFKLLLSYPFLLF